MNTLKSNKSNTMVAIVLIGLAVGILFWPVFFEGSTSTGRYSNLDPFLFTSTNQAPSPLQNPILTDQINQFYVWHRIAATAQKATAPFHSGTRIFYRATACSQRSICFVLSA
jgi:hypothetical protein